MIFFLFPIVASNVCHKGGCLSFCLFIYLSNILFCPFCRFQNMGFGFMEESEQKEEQLHLRLFETLAFSYTGFQELCIPEME